MPTTSKAIGIILTYNCASMLESTVRRIPKGMLDAVIVSDDGSSDGTVAIARKLGLTVFKHPHTGYGGNIKYGLARAMELGADCCIEIHGDGQYDPAVIPAALECMRAGCDMLLGTRFSDPRQALRDGMPFSRYATNRAFSLLCRIVLRIPLSEFFSGFRGYSRRLVETLDFSPTGDNYAFSFEVIVQAKYFGLRIEEIPVRCDYRGEHTSENFWHAALPTATWNLSILTRYLLARVGLIHDALFRRKK